MMSNKVGAVTVHHASRARLSSIAGVLLHCGFGHALLFLSGRGLYFRERELQQTSFPVELAGRIFS